MHETRKNGLNLNQKAKDLEPYDVSNRIWGQDAQGDSIRTKKFENKREERKP